MKLFFSTGDQHELDSRTNAPSIGKTGKTLNYGNVAQMLKFFQDAKNCSMLSPFLLGTGTGNVISDKDRVPGSHNTAAAKQSSQHKV